MRNLLVVVAVLSLVMTTGSAGAKEVDVHPIQTKQTLDCTGAIPIACGDVVNGTNIGGVNNVDYYSCVGWNESGPEVVYEFVVTDPDCYSLTAAISGMTADLDVFILGSCDEDDCLTYGNVSATTDCLEPGTYYIVVDGYDGAESDFTLEVTCEPCDCPGPCPPEQNYMPFFEDFEREECFPPAGWLTLNLGDDPAGETWEWADYNVCHGLGTARCYWGASAEYQDEWFITPIIYLDGADCVEIRFQHYTSVWSYCTHPMEVLVSTTGTNPSDFVLAWTFGCDTESDCEWVSITYGVPMADHFYVAWRYQGVFAGAWYVDNIMIDVSGSSGAEPSTWGTIKALYH